MLEGLNSLELGRLRMSVGYGSNKKGRPLSPIEVARLLDRALQHGNTLTQCAKEVHLDQTNVAKFLRLLKLPHNLRHLVDWGHGTNVLGFSVATELVRIESVQSMRSVARAVLEHGLNSKEVRQVVQILKRSKRTPEEILQEVIGMRPVIVRRFVFIGSVSSPSLKDALTGLSQLERDTLLRDVIKRLELLNASGRLGTQTFTLVGGEEFGSAIKRIGQDKLEGQISGLIGKGMNGA